MASILDARHFSRHALPISAFLPPDAGFLTHDAAGAQRGALATRPMAHACFSTYEIQVPPWMLGDNITAPRQAMRFQADAIYGRAIMMHDARHGRYHESMAEAPA